ncbi:hypothetical protein GQ457_14G020530 [Hibiscus cannabinus]
MSISFNNIETGFKLVSPASLYTHRLTFTNRAFVVHCVRPDSTGNTTSSSLEGGKGNFDDESRVLEIGDGDQQKDDFGDGGGNEGGGFGGGDSGDGGNEGSVWPLGFLIKYCSMLRNRMLADPSFLFKVGTEIVIDSCCATFAEIQKRGNDFWTEFELYLADLLVGMVVDIALVGMLAPYARFGQPSASRGLYGSLQRATAALPSRSL